MVAGGCGDDDLVWPAEEAAVDDFDVPAGHLADQVAALALAASIGECGEAALAVAGDEAGAEAILRELRGLRPDDTLLHSAYLPVVEAALFLARNKPADAIEVLRRAIAAEQHAT